MQMFMPTGLNWTGTRLARFIEGNGFRSLEDLQAAAVMAPGPFWQMAAREVGVVWSRPPSGVAPRPAPGGWHEWFRAGGYNPLRNLLVQHARSAPERLALRARDDRGRVRHYSFAQLLEAVSRVAAGLHQAGVAAGQRVAVCMPMGVEAVVSMLALVGVGAVIVPVPTQALIQRLARRGRDWDVRWAIGAEPRATAAIAKGGCPVLEYGSLAEGPAPAGMGLESGAPEGGMWVPGARTRGREAGQAYNVPELAVKSAWDLAAALDVAPGDKVMMVADQGWEMWPWLILGALQLGAGVLVCHGLDQTAAEGDQWGLAESEGVTHLCLRSAQLSRIVDLGPWPLPSVGVASLRILGLFDNPTDLGAWHWLFRELGGCRFPVVAVHGELASGGLLFAAFPGFPVKPCTMIGPIPGVGVLVRPTAQVWGSPRGQRLTLSNTWPGIAVERQWIPTRTRKRVELDVDGFWKIGK